jgi:hypothetical protein
MDIFNVHRRDVHTFDNWMDLKKPGFGGHETIEQLKDNKGKFVNKDRKLSEFQRTVTRHEAFNHDVWNPTYKAMGGDLVNKQEHGKNPNAYPDLYDNMGIAQVSVGKTNEGMCYSTFESFITESAVEPETDEDCDCEDCDCEKD